MSAPDKKTIVDAFLGHKEEYLEDFRTNQRTKLNQTSGEDMDNKHHESKTEETIHELELLNHNTEILEKEIMLLKNIPLDANMDHAQYGSLLETDQGWMLVAAANEKMDVQGTPVLGISTAAPLFKKMSGLKAGDSFELNGAKHKLISVN